MVYNWAKVFETSAKSPNSAKRAQHSGLRRFLEIFFGFIIVLCIELLAGALIVGLSTIPACIALLLSPFLATLSQRLRQGLRGVHRGVSAKSRAFAMSLGLKDPFNWLRWKEAAIGHSFMTSSPIETTFIIVFTTLNALVFAAAVIRLDLLKRHGGGALEPFVGAHGTVVLAEPHQARRACTPHSMWCWFTAVCAPRARAARLLAASAARHGAAPAPPRARVRDLPSPPPPPPLPRTAA